MCWGWGQCLSREPWSSAVFLLFWEEEAAWLLAVPLALVKSPRGSSSVEQLPKAAGVN